MRPRVGVQIIEKIVTVPEKHYIEVPVDRVVDRVVRVPEIHNIEVRCLGPCFSLLPFLV